MLYKKLVGGHITVFISILLTELTFTMKSAKNEASLTVAILAIFWQTAVSINFRFTCSLQLGTFTNAYNVARKLKKTSLKTVVNIKS